MSGFRGGNGQPGLTRNKSIALYRTDKFPRRLIATNTNRTKQMTRASHGWQVSDIVPYLQKVLFVTYVDKLIYMYPLGTTALKHKHQTLTQWRQNAYRKGQFMCECCLIAGPGKGTLSRGCQEQEYCLSGFQEWKWLLTLQSEGPGVALGVP